MVFQHPCFVIDHLGASADLVELSTCRHHDLQYSSLRPLAGITILGLVV